jgi:predicted nucleic acid-binding protein
MKPRPVLNNLIDSPIEVESPAHRADVLPVLADLMQKHRLTSYDAAYLELVIRRNLPLATLDKALIDACKKLGKTPV